MSSAAARSAAILSLEAAGSDEFAARTNPGATRGAAAAARDVERKARRFIMGVRRGLGLVREAKSADFVGVGGKTAYEWPKKFRHSIMQCRSAPRRSWIGAD